MKSNNKKNTNHIYQYDIPFKDRLKQKTKEDDRNCYNLYSVSTAVVILIVLIKMIMMIFKAIDFKEDEDMYHKTAYDDVSRYADTVEHTTTIASQNAATICNKGLILESNHNETNIATIISPVMHVINQISSKYVAEVSLHAMKQTITTNEGLLEYGKLTVTNIICIKLFDLTF